MNNDLLLDQGPLLPGYGSREPSIRQLITKYYAGAFDVPHALRLTTKYLNQMKKEAGKNPPPHDWLEDREFYEAMQIYRHSGYKPEEVVDAFEAVKTLIRKRTERCIPSHELEALPAPLPMPPLGKTPFKIQTFSGGYLWVYDQFYVHTYAVAYADASMRAALGIKAPIAVPVVCPYDSWKPAKELA